MRITTNERLVNGASDTNSETSDHTKYNCTNQNAAFKRIFLMSVIAWAAVGANLILVLMIALRMIVMPTITNGISISFALICVWANYKRWRLAQPNVQSLGTATGRPG